MDFYGCGLHLEEDAVAQAIQEDFPRLLFPLSKQIGMHREYLPCSLRRENADLEKYNRCTITVAGFAKGSDQEVALASFTFTPPLVEVAPVPMEHAVLPSTFSLLKIVNVTIIQDDPTTEALVVDNVHGFLSTS